MMIYYPIRIRSKRQRLARMPNLPATLLPCFPVVSRKLRGAGLFFSPSLDGGLLLFPLFKPKRRRRSSFSAIKMATLACKARIAFSNSAIFASRSSIRSVYSKK
jgi:hypothetical protein